MSPETNHEFENELAQIPQRSAPPDLQSMILNEADVVERQSWFLDWFWAVPIPIKAGVAAVWILAVFMRLTTPEVEPIGAMNFDEPPSQIYKADPEVMLAFSRADVEAFLETESNNLF